MTFKIGDKIIVTSKIDNMFGGHGTVCKLEEKNGATIYRINEFPDKYFYFDWELTPWKKKPELKEEDLIL